MMPNPPVDPVSHRKDEIDKLVQAQTKLDPYGVNTPKKLNKNLQLVVDVSPFGNKEILTKVKVAAGDFFTTSTSKDTYLIGIHASASMDIGDGGNGSVDVVWTAFDGTPSQYTIFSSAGAGVGSGVSGDFTIPQRGIKLKRGSLVSLNVAASFGTGTIFYYEDDPAVSSMHFDD